MRAWRLTARWSRRTRGSSLIVTLNVDLAINRPHLGSQSLGDDAGVVLGPLLVAVGRLDFWFDSCAASPAFALVA